MRRKIYWSNVLAGTMPGLFISVHLYNLRNLWIIFLGGDGFMAFVKVAETADVKPGAGRVVDAGSRELALFNVDGEFYCIDNACPHAEGPLGEGYVEGAEVICPWHAWQFNVKTGEMAYNPQICVATFPCKVENGDVLVDV